MPLTTMKELLMLELNELYAAEKHGAQVLPELVKAAANPELSSALEEQQRRTNEHVARLESVFTELNAWPRPISRSESKGMRGLFQDSLRLANLTKAEPHVRDAALISVAQHVLHDEIAGYGCARSWAALLGYDESATRLEKSLEEERTFDIRLTRLAENINKQALATLTHP
ncbi:MAG: DUF892 family protein [Planctomycetes bacterium]|nr:DUF892 family protein [Planctomycetota bacterium]